MLHPKKVSDDVASARVLSVQDHCRFKWWLLFEYNGYGVQKKQPWPPRPTFVSIFQWYINTWFDARKTAYTAKIYVLQLFRELLESWFTLVASWLSLICTPYDEKMQVKAPWPPPAREVQRHPNIKQVIDPWPLLQLAGAKETPWVSFQRHLFKAQPRESWGLPQVEQTIDTTDNDCAINKLINSKQMVNEVTETNCFEMELHVGKISLSTSWKIWDLCSALKMMLVEDIASACKFRNITKGIKRAIDRNILQEGCLYWFLFI